MASYRILYWQEIPSQVRAWDDFDEVSIALPERFVARIDQAAQQRGLVGTDAYLAEWRWGDEQQRDGTAQEVAQAVARELEAAP